MEVPSEQPHTVANTAVAITGVAHVPASPAVQQEEMPFAVVQGQAYMRMPQDHTVVPAAELNRQIFNCGSVGQPRDGDPRASYLIYDDQRRVIEFYRVAYDFHRTAEKILAAGLPKAFALRLADGI